MIHPRPALRYAGRVDYKYNQRAGALNEAAAAPARAKSSSLAASSAGRLAAGDLFDGDDYASAHATGVAMMPVAAAPMHAQSRMQRTLAAGAGGGAPPPPADGSGIDPIAVRGGVGMFFYTVQDGQRVRVIDEHGKVTIVAGPQRIFRMGRRIEPMAHHLAHPGEFLIVRFRDGRQEHLVGPADLWFDPRRHARVDKEDALQIASKEAIVVYSKDEERQGHAPRGGRPGRVRPRAGRVAPHLLVARIARRGGGLREGPERARLPEALVPARPDVPRRAPTSGRATTPC